MPPRRIGDTGRKAEKALSKRVRAKPTLASGAANGDKGDMVLGRFLIEAKSTVRDRYTVTLADLCKINHEALMADKLPAFALQFTDLAGQPVGRQKQSSWVAVPEHVFQLLVGRTVKEDE